MVPNLPHIFEFIHLKDRKDLPHLGLVVFLVAGIILGVYLALQPQIFSKRADEGSLVEVKFEPEALNVQKGRVYEVKIAVNPKAQRVTAVQLDLGYDPAALTILEAKNEGFLPITLKTRDSFDGNLTLIYGGTVQTQAVQLGTAATIKFKFIGDSPSVLSIKPGSQVSVSSKEGNVLTSFSKLDLNTGGVVQIQPEGGAVKYLDKLLLEKAFFPDSGPFVEEFKEAIEPGPELKPERVKPELSEKYILQLGRDIFIEPIIALNQVITEKAGEIINRSEK